MQDYGRTEEHIKTLNYVNELAQATKALTQEKNPNNLLTMLDLGNKWRGIGQAQDDLLQRFHRMGKRRPTESGKICENWLEELDKTQG